METKQKQNKKTWEYKDRNYYLIGNKTPLTYTIPTKHSSRYPLVCFDEDLGYERELRYATNQSSIYVDEQEGQVTLKHVIFNKGHLFVPKEKRNLQEFLDKHPHNGVIFKMYDPVIQAEDEYENLEYEVAALNLAYEMDIDQAEAILRVEKGTSVNSLSSKELRRDLLLFAKSDPKLFINLSEDENVVLRNFGINAVEANILKLDANNKIFSWASNGRKLMTVPFDEHPYTALASWFKTDEGIEVYKSIEKKLK